MQTNEVKLLNPCSEEMEMNLKTISREEMAEMEIATFTAAMPCCDCGDQWSSPGTE
ncbi:MAG: hypothetical protein NTY07_11705 [Bacteroidia bacterium]|nr:hypothetical protein [Bacteroidia bacterium]